MDDNAGTGRMFRREDGPHSLRSNDETRPRIQQTALAKRLTDRLNIGPRLPMDSVEGWSIQGHAINLARSGLHQNLLCTTSSSGHIGILAKVSRPRSLVSEWDWFRPPATIKAAGPQLLEHAGK